MLLTILAFIVVLGITITVHEFGHFAMAKLLKIRVLVFSIGFGPRLTGFTRGGTDYRISSFPLGGYVRMAGEAFDEERQGGPDEFLSHPRWHRFLVALAGPVMNILLAVAILTAAYLEGLYVPKFYKGPAIVGPVAADSIARRAGLRSGDKITAVRGSRVRTWEEMEIALATAPKDTLDVLVERGAERVQLRFDPPQVTTLDPGVLGFKSTLPKTVVAALDPKSPAQLAGLKVGDEILSVARGGRIGRTYDDILNIISESKAIPLDFEVRRPAPGRPDDQQRAATARSDSPGEILHLTIAPFEDKGRVLVGFYPEVPTDFDKFGLGGAIVQSIRRNYDLTVLTFKLIGRILTGSASVKTISGPLGIARISGTAARSGSARVFFGIVGLVSLQLGVFNLLPIPILDGGVIALLLIEGALRRDLSIRLKEKIVQVGLVFLMLLMGLVVFNDLAQIVPFNKLFR